MLPCLCHQLGGSWSRHMNMYHHLWKVASPYPSPPSPVYHCTVSAVLFTMLPYPAFYPGVLLTPLPSFLPTLPALWNCLQAVYAISWTLPPFPTMYSLCRDMFLQTGIPLSQWKRRGAFWLYACSAADFLGSTTCLPASVPFFPDCSIALPD